MESKYPRVTKKRYLMKDNIKPVIDYALSIEPKIKENTNKPDIVMMRSFLFDYCSKQGATHQFIADYIGMNVSRVTQSIIRIPIYEIQLKFNPKDRVKTFRKLLINFDTKTILN